MKGGRECWGAVVISEVMGTRVSIVMYAVKKNYREKNRKQIQEEESRVRI